MATKHLNQHFQALDHSPRRVCNLTLVLQVTLIHSILVTIRLVKNGFLGHLGGSVGWASDFGSGHDLTVPEFDPCVGLCADSSEPGACFGFCLLISLPFPCSCSVLCVSQK